MVCKSNGHSDGMRRVITLIAVATVGVLSAASAGAGSSSSLKLVRMHPLVVAGAGFHAGEHVRVTVYAKITRVERTTATLRGAFRTSFGNVPVGRCSGFRVVAVGNLGSRATLKRPPLPACLPA